MDLKKIFSPRIFSRPKGLLRSGNGHAKKSSFHLRFEGMIWKILIDPLTNTLVLEIRNGETRSVTFSAYALNAQKFLWENLECEEPWWLGLEEAYNGFVILHEYINPQSPEHKCVFVHEEKSGKPLWQNLDVTFYRLAKKGIVTYESDKMPRTFQCLDYSSGKKIMDVTDETVLQKEIESCYKEKNKNLIFPETTAHGSPEYNSYQRRIKIFEEKNIAQQMDAANYKHYDVISYYTTNENNLLDNRIIVLDKRTENSKLQEVLAVNQSGFSYDTFFMWSGILFFIKNKSELVGYSLD